MVEICSKIQNMDRQISLEMPVSEQSRGEFASALKSRNVTALESLWKEKPQDYQKLVAEKAKQIGDQITSRRGELSVEDELALRNKFGEWFKAFPGVDEIKTKTMEEVVAERANILKLEVTSVANTPIEKFDDYKKRMIVSADSMDPKALLEEARKLNRSQIFFPKWFAGVVNGNGEPSSDDLNRLREWFKNPDMGELVATI